MRADLYLHHVRIFKTRNIAMQACDKGNVRIAGQHIKPARELRPGDVLEVQRGELKLTVQVVDFPASRVGAPLVSKYLEDLTPVENYKRAAEANRLRHLLTPHELAAKPDKKQMRQIRAWIDLQQQDQE